MDHYTIFQKSYCEYKEPNTYCGEYNLQFIKNEEEILRQTVQCGNITHNRVELMGLTAAITWALQNATGQIGIFSDSQYAVKGYNDWVFGWVKKERQDIKNLDLWLPLHKLRADNIKVGWMDNKSLILLMNCYKPVVETTPLTLEEMMELDSQDEIDLGWS